MNADMLVFVQDLDARLPVLLMVFLRVGAAMALLPAFGERTIPQRIRLVLAGAFTVVVVPMAPPDLVPAEPGIGAYLWYGAIEVAAGLAIGISLRLFAMALQVAGAIAAQTTSLSQIFGTAAVDPQPAIGHILLISGLALAVTVGLHVQFVRYVLLSYQMLPPGAAIPAADMAEWGTFQIARAFDLAFAISAPFVIASLIYNIALGAINRAMPQLMVSFVGAPAITFGGLLLMLLTAPYMLAVWIDTMGQFLADPFTVAP